MECTPNLYKDGNILSIDRENLKFVSTPEDEMWEQRRYEITKDVFAYNSTDVTGSVKYADELIEALKEK